MEIISETLVFNTELTRLIAQEDISTLILRESFKPLDKVLLRPGRRLAF
jgi:hypothetical protein